MKSILITGCNRGIGLGFVQHLLKSANTATSNIFATCRNPQQAKELTDLAQKHGNLKILQLDVKDFDSYKDVVKQVQDVVGDAGLNLLVNNAGVSSKFTRVNLVKADQMTDNFLVNSVAPLMLTKASLNAITRSLSFDLKEDKVLVVSIHPGWIKTDMGGKQAPLEIDQAVPQIIQLFNTMSQSHNGGFYQYDGKQLPW
ncbi:C-factor isoform X1 [Nilaparvata lugens]|uniref:C-factor isoform X1 n=1 Tax=Nilaparvata lugens TaxID=108931 RepID=UPI00193CDE8A|nr:C-factor isoform X1 [Nilaparvata lugens]